jgi:hypothetical protein
MKRTVIDAAARTEYHTLSRRRYVIDRRLERSGSNLFLDRSWISHPEISGCRSILLPRHHLWVMFYEGHQGQHPCLCYIHVARIHDEGLRITVEDLYLDVLIGTDGRWQVVDVDEFRAAITGGELSAEQVEAALIGLEHACRWAHEAGSSIATHIDTMLQLEGDSCSVSSKALGSG